MYLARLIVCVVMISSLGCGPSEPTLEATWTDTEDRVFVEFTNKDIFLGDKSMKVRLASGTYQYIDADTIEITFNEVGQRVRKYAKDPKKGVGILHDSFASQADEDNFQDVIRVSVKLKDQRLEIQSPGKPVVAWQLGKPFKM